MSFPTERIFQTEPVIVYKGNRLLTLKTQEGIQLPKPRRSPCLPTAPNTTANTSLTKQKCQIRGLSEKRTKRQNKTPKKALYPFLAPRGPSSDSNSAHRYRPVQNHPSHVASLRKADTMCWMQKWGTRFVHLQPNDLNEMMGTFLLPSWASLVL